MSSSGGAARSFYDALRSQTANSKCPLCGVGLVAALDHHLPKARYPYLAVCPYNLIPACQHCNTAKGMKYPANAYEQTIHPYYDDFSQEQWIIGAIASPSPDVLNFSVLAPPHWSTVRQAKAHRHFSVMKLGLVYSSNANDDLTSLKKSLAMIYEHKGPTGVWDYLRFEEMRRAETPNSWDHILYQTLANDGWFIHGGFINIGGPSA